jgi:hypothetical protein
LRSPDLAAAKDTTWIADANSLLTLWVISRSNNRSSEVVVDVMALKTLALKTLSWFSEEPIQPG